MTPETKVFDSVEGMTPVCKTALRNVLLACADTKLFLGYHYGEWTFGPPEIEAAIACCSLCQTELGHVRLLHALLNKHFGENPDELVEARKPTEYANISYLDQEIKDWPGFVAANYLVDLAVTTLLHSMQNSSFKPLHMSLEKMLQEERYHIHHGQGWFRTLAQKNETSKSEMAVKANAALQKVIEWFGPADDQEDAELVKAGIKKEPNQQVLQRYLGMLAELAESLQIDLGLTQKGGAWQAQDMPEWNGWSPTSRRIGQTAPDEQILYHLRGSKNKVFKLG